MQIIKLTQSRQYSHTLDREVDVIEVSYTITVIDRFIVIRTAEFFAFLGSKDIITMDYFETYTFDEQCIFIKEFLNFITK